MPSPEICIIVLPNDFPDDEKDDKSWHSSSSSVAENVNEKKKTKNDGQRWRQHQSKVDAQTTEQTTTPDSNIRQRKSTKQAASKHTEEYPCPACVSSLCCRFRYHTIPKLELRDTVWIPTNNNKSFFIICYTELGPQSDGILDELRRAEIGIRNDSKVFVVPINCALGIKKVVAKQKTLENTSETASDGDYIGDGGGDMPVATPLPLAQQPFQKFKKSIRARLTVQKVLGGIRQQSSLTFDYLFFCVLASFIACLGLLENNTV